MEKLKTLLMYVAAWITVLVMAVAGILLFFGVQPR